MQATGSLFAEGVMLLSSLCRTNMQKGAEAVKGRLPACEGQLTMW